MVSKSSSSLAAVYVPMEACSELNSHRRVFSDALMMQASQENIHGEALSWHRKHHAQSLGRSS